MKIGVIIYNMTDIENSIKDLRNLLKTAPPTNFMMKSVAITISILERVRDKEFVERATDQNILCRDCEYRVGKVASPATEHELEVLRKNYASQVKYTTTLEDKVRKLEASPVITADLEKLRPALEKLLCKATDDLGYVYSGDGKKDITDTLADCRAAMIKEDEDEARYKTQMPQVRNIKPR